MGFSVETAKQFFDLFMRAYLDTDDEARLREVTEKAALLGYMRMIYRLWKKGAPSERGRKQIARYLEKVAELATKVETLNF